MSHFTPPKTNSKFKVTKFIILNLILNGCAAELQFSTPTGQQGNPALTSQNAEEAALMGAYVTFNFADYYSLAAPNPSTGCAGDVNSYYDPLAYILPNYPAGIVGVKSVTGPAGPYKLPQDIVNPSSTIRPAFLKNVSVDMTDANAPVTTNNAFACSLGNGPTAPRVSNCATFDYGAIDGIPSTLGGTLLILGGLQTTNFSGIESQLPVSTNSLALTCGTSLTGSAYNNSCSSSMYALAVNSLPASAATGLSNSLAPGLTSSTTSISSWGNISGTTGYSGPPALAGGSIAYDALLKQILLIGGVSYMSGLKTSPGGGVYLSDTWTYDLKLQKWTETNQNFTVNTHLQTTSDFAPFAPGGSTTFVWNKGAGGRALFGYVALPGSAIGQLSASGLVTGANGSGIDTTDRIFIAGGLCNDASAGTCTDVHRFNPTYGPEYFDLEAPISSINTFSILSQPTQWIDSYHSSIVVNATQGSLLSAKFPAPYPSPSEVPLSDADKTPYGQSAFGMVGLNNNFPLSAGGTGLGVNTLASPLPGSVNAAGTGYLLTAGGFYGTSGISGAVNVPQGTSCTSILECGGMQLGLRWFGSTWNESNELSSANFSSISNENVFGYEITPLQWAQVVDNPSTDDTIPWFGGGVMLKGINVPPSTFTFPSPIPAPLPATIPAEATNQVVYFGGADCRTYLTNGPCPNWAPTGGVPTGNPGRYYNFGIDPAATFHSPVPPQTITTAGFAPQAAGMAAARGNDAQNNPLIVALGGMTGPGKIDNSGTIYYLYYNNDSSSKSPTWTSTTPLNTGPVGLANASLVFSHVTGKFYLFGGVNPNTGTMGDTWELTVSAISSSYACGVSPVPNCQFSWRLLNAASGMTCYPTCPPARRSHRMVEANYHYFNAPFEPNCSSPSRPCSFGLFMEGGTPNGLTPFLTDRWMFDPTANAGQGHWQRMGEFPPRTLASSASVDYTIPATGVTVHRTVLFGGETGLQNPAWATQAAVSTQPSPAPPGYFIPPTLGDTWMYDLDTPQWQRVKLYGHRYDPSALNSISAFGEQEARQASLVSDPTTTHLSPPPLSGAIMVTRTQTRPNHLATDTAQNLAIPQVFLFGGRKKDGYYNLLNNVYKFCAGTTGEKPYPTSLSGISVPLPDDASCDSFDPILNPSSTSPTADYAGRWLLKSPLGKNGLDSSQLATFMGAGVYDSTHDLIVLYGGLTPSAAPFSSAAVTDLSNRNVNTNIYEYTPPSAVQYGPNSSQFNGSWQKIQNCAESTQNPIGRYGHTMGYDPTHQAVIVVGGYDLNGNPLVQTQTDTASGTTYQIPETWAGYRIDKSTSIENTSLNIPSITIGPFPCYYWTNITTFGNDITIPSQAPPSTGLSHASSIYIPSTGYNSGYYTAIDNSCINAGPISSTDTSINKLNVGGAYFDIDRTQLGPHENLILNLTILPLGPYNTDPNQNDFTSSDSAIFKIHLDKIGQSGDIIRQQIQPRDLIYASTDQYPQTVQDLSIITPVSGQIRQEQIYIPLTTDPGIDRIRIERYSGSAILIDASIFRTGKF